MSVSPVLPSLATLAMSPSPDVPARLPLNPAAELYKTPLSALEQRWGLGIPLGKPDQRSWKQSWFGVDGVTTSYAFTADGRLQRISLELMLAPEERDRPDSAERRQATKALSDRGAALTANLFQDLGKPLKGGPSPGYLNSDSHQMWEREDVTFWLQAYGPEVEVDVSRRPLIVSETVTVVAVGALVRIVLGTLYEDCSGGDSELVLDATAASIMADRLDEVFATQKSVDIAAPPDRFKIAVSDGAPQLRVAVQNLRDPAAVAGGAYWLTGMLATTARTLASALRAPAPPRAIAGDLPTLVGNALAMVKERLQNPLIPGYAKKFLDAIEKQLLDAQQTIASGAKPNAEQVARLAQSISAAREGNRLYAALGEVLFDLACSYGR